jgi:hypothetical protein
VAARIAVKKAVAAVAAVTLDNDRLENFISLSRVLCLVVVLQEIAGNDLDIIQIQSLDGVTGSLHRNWHTILPLNKAPLFS